MADATVLKEFLAVVGYRVDEASQRKFTDAITGMTKLVEGLGLGIASAAAAVVTGVASMAASGEQMYYLAQRVKDTVTNIDAFVFAMTKMGVTAPEAIKSIQTFADVLRNSPGDRGLIEALVGKGTPEEQLTRLSAYLQKQTPEMQRILRQQLQRVIPSEDFWLGLLRAGLPGGQDECKNTLRRFGFDPDEFSKQSVKFENQVRDFLSRLNALWGHVSQETIDSLTNGLIRLNDFLDTHAAQIEEQIDRVVKAFIKFGVEVGHVVIDVVSWFDRLTASQKEVVEALTAIGAVFLLGGWGKLILIGYALSKLLDDYEKFRETGTSDLGIPWEKLAKSLDWVIEKLGAINDATGGWINALDIIGAIFGVKLLLSMRGFFTVAFSLFTGIGAAATTAGGIISTVFGGALTVVTGIVGALTSIPALAALATAATISQNKEHIASQEEEDKLLGGTAAQRNPQNVIGIGTSETDEKRKAFFDWLKGIGTSIKEAILPGARADELPDNLKLLNQSVSELHDFLADQVLQNALPGGLGGGGGGLLPGFSSIGGGGGGGGGKKLDFNDPKVIESVRFFMSKGWNLAQASGIVANLYAESSLNPDAFNAAGGGNGAMGIAQWRGDRQKKFEQVEGVPLKGSTREQQMDFYNWELTHTEAAGGNALRASNDARQSAEILRSMVQRPGASDRSGPTRMSYAESLNQGPLMANPNINTDSSKSIMLNQTNTVTVNGASDANASARALKDVQNQHWAEVTRNLQGAYQ